MIRSVASNRKQILIVDDEPLSSAPIRIMLEKAEYKIRTALDGLEAQKLFQEHEFDLVVTDVGIPFLDGIRLLEWIKKTKPVPVILMTGFSEYLSEEAAYELGAQGFLLKPFSLKQAKELVNRCLSEA